MIAEVGEEGGRVGGFRDSDIVTMRIPSEMR